ncbi:MAG: GNAT family N-acetyltransferase [Candidatus Helarchaeota archaeon]
MTFVVREVKKEDKDQITDLARQMVESLNEPFLSTLWLGLLQLFFSGLEKNETDREIKIFCAENTADKELVGMLVAKVELDKKRRKYGKTAFWYVRPSFRGKQIGFELSKKSHEFFKESGAEYTDLNLRSDEKAKKIVEGLGFTKLYTRYRKYFK